MSAENGPGSEWNIEAVDVGEYLDRVKHPLPEPTADALWSLHEAHVATFPFENIDVVLGQHRGLSPEVIAEKFLRRRRGGYCYEHALLFAAVLENLGYRVWRRIARVKPRQPGAATHMVLAVEADGAEYFVDIAFGAGMLHPMPLRDGAHADQAGWEHRLTWDGLLWTVEKRTVQGWEPQHASTELPQHPVDYEVAHHYTSTHPRSPFVQRPVVMRLEPGLNRKLVGRELSSERPDGTTESVEIAPNELGTTLSTLGVDLTSGELAALVDHEQRREAA